MPQLGTADVTYTRVEGTSFASPSAPMKEHQFLLLMPNSTNVLYTSGGIPLSNGQLGCPAGLIKFIMEDAGSTTGYVPKWDQKANTIRIYQQAGVTTAGSTAGQLIEMTTAATVASTTLRVIAAGW